MFARQCLVFFHIGTLPSFINETLVALVPKVDKPEKIGQLRPISCCNFLYKVITKILVTKLKPFLNDLVSQAQSAFISGRQIQDNILVAQEAFHFLKKARRGPGEFMALKLDMNKAYERLEWDFLQPCLEAFGFSEKWVTSIMTCVKGATYRFKVNGEISKKIFSQRGLRQGNPLSPYLFFLVAEAMSCMLIKAQEEGRIKGMKIAPKCPVVTHLLFADDFLIFAQATQEEAYQLVTILNDYTTASGQKISTEKSGIIFSKHTSQATPRLVPEILSMQEWSAPGKYLGLPAEWGRSRNNTLSWLKLRVLDKIDGWKEKLLNQAGKEVLIKAVIQALPSYAMSIIRLPKNFCRSLCSSIARFWWRNPGREREGSTGKIETSFLEQSVEGDLTLKIYLL